METKRISCIGCGFITLFIGSVLLASGIVAHVSFIPRFSKKQVNEQTALVPEYGSMRYDAFLSSDKQPPQYVRFWYYNLTNPDEFTSGAKARVAERGPYTYRLRIDRFNVSHSEDKSMVEFLYSKKYTFQPDMSVGPETDKFTLVNIVYMGATQFIYHSNGPCSNTSQACPDTLIGALSAPTNTSLLETITAKEITFGRTEPLIAAAAPQADPFFMFMANCTDYASCRDLNFKDHYFGMGGSCKVVEYPPFNYKGCLSPDKTPNSTYIHRMHTGYGVDNMANTGQFDAWCNNKTIATEYMPTDLVPREDTAFRVHGTDGVNFHPYVSRDDVLTVFNDETIRSLDLQYEKDATFQDISGYRFGPTDYAFPDQGMRNITAVAGVKYGQPSPAFATPVYFEGVTHPLAGSAECINCNASARDTSLYAIVEPTTGLSVSGRIRVQMSAHVGQPELFGRPDYACAKEGNCPHAKMPETLMPLLWFEVAADMTQSETDKLGKSLRLMHLAKYAPWALVALGGVLAFVGLSLMIKFGLCVSKSKPVGRRLDDKDWPRAYVAMGEA